MNNDFYGTGFLVMVVIGAFLVFVGWGEGMFLFRASGFLLVLVGLILFSMYLMDEYTSYYTPPPPSRSYGEEVMKQGFFFAIFFFVGGVFVVFETTRDWMPYAGLGISYFGVWLFKKTLKDLRRFGAR